MVTPRRSARVAASDSSPNYNEDEPSSGRKRKNEGASSSPSAKRGKKSAPKKQKTIEDTMDIDEKQTEQPVKEQNAKPAASAEDAPKPEEQKEDTTEEKTEEPKEAPQQEKPAGPIDSTPASAPEPAKDGKPTEPENKTEELSNGPALATEKPTEPAAVEPAPTVEPPKADKPTEKPVEQERKPGEESNGSLPAPAVDKPSVSAEQTQDSTSAQQPPKTVSNGSIESKQEKPESAPVANGTAVEPNARDGDVPSSILEKGIIYFFFRPRVNISDPQDITDIARSYMVLRPIPKDAKLGDGPIGDDENVRLIAIPKKVLPASGKDRFMAFVETAQASFSQLKSDFMSASEYATKTAGTSHSPPVTPLAEGVYAITTTGRESHLAYMITIPNQLGEVQKDVGIKESGSFVVSAKNPKFPGPANANIGKDPGFPESIMQEFRDLRWMPLQPKLLDYANTQFLLIGESSGIEKALEQLPRDEKKDTETPLEEMEKLEGEDEIRVKHLKGDDAVFADLGISKKEYPQVPTTW